MVYDNEVDENDYDDDDVEIFPFLLMSMTFKLTICHGTSSIFDRNV